MVAKNQAQIKIDEMRVESKLSHKKRLNELVAVYIHRGALQFE
jgi:hypothetical protein